MPNCVDNSSPQLPISLDLVGKLTWFLHHIVGVEGLLLVLGRVGYPGGVVFG